MPSPRSHTEGRKKPFQMTHLFTQARDFSASSQSLKKTKKPQRNKGKKEENKRNKASQSTNNLVGWTLARDADGSDSNPSKHGFVPLSLQHSQ